MSINLDLSLVQVDDLKEALQEMFKTSGVKGTPLLFLMTDGQIVNERFLIYINDILANGWISDLFPKASSSSTVPPHLPCTAPDMMNLCLVGAGEFFVLQNIPALLIIVCVRSHRRTCARVLSYDARVVRP